jgi:hypothetical protein
MLHKSLNNNHLREFCDGLLKVLNSVTNLEHFCHCFWSFFASAFALASLPFLLVFA